MGWVETRTGRDGRPRYIAKYRDLCGRKRSAGTFASKREANSAWQRAEVQVAEGQLTDPRRGRQTFRRYVEERWLPHHVMEPTTRAKYTYYLNAHIMPEFGPMRIMDILPEHVRAWITRMQAKSASAWTIQYGKYAILNSVFTTRHGRPGDHFPPEPWGADADGSQQAAADHDSAIRRHLPGAAQRRHATAGRNGRPERAALGRADRTPDRGPFAGDEDPDGEPQGDRGQPEVRAKREALRGQGLPEGQGVPAAQAERPARAEDRGPC